MFEFPQNKTQKYEFNPYTSGIFHFCVKDPNIEELTAKIVADGGVSFVGGIGKISGIVIGVIMLRLIFVALPLVGMDQNLQYAIKGGIILFACALDMRKYLVKK